MLTLAIALLTNAGSLTAVALIANVNSLDPITWSIKKLPLNWSPVNPSVNKISPTLKLCALLEVAYTNSVLASDVLIISFSNLAVTRIFLTPANPDISTLFSSAARVILPLLSETTSPGMYVEPGCTASILTV